MVVRAAVVKAGMAVPMVEQAATADGAAMPDRVALAGRAAT
jgi:hypothetical protein